MTMTAAPHDRAQQDRELVAQIRRRDQQALMALYRRYGALVYSLALRVVRIPVAAEEVTQDVFLKVWQQPERWDPAGGQFSSWLLTITRNAAIDRLRKEQRHAAVQVEASDELWATAGSNSVTDDPRWYDGQELARLVGRLPPEQRQLIELAFFAGMTHSELAERLGLPLGTIKTRLRTGLLRLRSLWQNSAE